MILPRIEALALAAIEDDSGIAPTVCRVCGKRGEDAEPDATDLDCAYCGSSRVDSVLVIAGFI